MSTKSKTSTPFRVVIISTGGTIEKTYCELGGVLSNQVSVLDVLLAQLELDGVEVSRQSDTGELLYRQLSSPDKPVVLTGAMRPFELRQTDAIQNITEALLAIQLLEPGIWCVMHNKAMRFPGVRKDRNRLTLMKE